MSRESQVRVNPDFLSLDTPFDRRIHRPAARAVSRFFESWPVHPNHLTLVSVMPAAAAAACFWHGNWAWGTGGLALFWIWAVLDHADGELARAKGLTSEFGKKLDDTCDTLASGVMMAGILGGLLGASRASHPLVWWAVFLGLVALNETAHHLALSQKRRLRVRVVTRGRAEASVVSRQKLLDHLSGREPFYLLIALYLASVAAGSSAAGALLAVLLAGTGAFAGFGFWTWITLSQQLTKDTSL